MLMQFVIPLQRDKLGENRNFVVNGGTVKVPCKVHTPYINVFKNPSNFDDILHFNVLVKIWFMV